MSVAFNQPNAWVFVVLAAIAVFGVGWFYWRVPASASGRLRALLIALRLSALSLLFAALIEPVLAIDRTVTERPVVAVLMDVSRSMAITDGTGGARRGDEAVALLNEVMLPRIARDADVEAFSFATGIHPLEVKDGELTGVPAFDGEATDLAQAFSGVGRELRGRNLGAVVIATDGAGNRGAGPGEAAVALGVPVFALGVGNPEVGIDIAIVDAVTNRISYSGERVPIEVTLASAGFAGSETVVELREGGMLLDSEQVELSGTGEETRLTFHVTPVEPGVHTYTVSVPPAQGELTTANNTRLVATNAMKGKIRVLLLGQRPSWDYAFIRRAIEADRNMEGTSAVVEIGSSATALTSKQNAIPRSSAELLSYDLAIIVGADWGAPPIDVEWLRSFVRDRGGGVLLVGIPEGRLPEAAKAILPVSLSGDVSRASMEARPRLTEEGETAPSMRLVSERFANTELWQTLPPLRAVAASTWIARPDAVVLAESASTDRDASPIIASRSEGAGNVMAILADELWRWKMAGPDDVDVFDRLVANVARLLTARGALDRVVVEADKDVYRTGEDVRISAQVYRSDYRLADNAEVTVAVSSGEGAAPVTTLALRPEGEFYRGTVGGLGPGAYLARASASIGGEDVGAATAEFAVEQYSMEDVETRRRSALLRRTADETAGGYYSPETLEQLPGDVPMVWTQREISREFEIWNSPLLLMGFVGLMSAEWALRRKQGMP
ncbi:MAG: hypothetical protein JXB46_01720 [Candidatus Eisenbacteria bacterium]|nr:hypothetical protein [Candidatus Eisenbacteria bacterium]